MTEKEKGFIPVMLTPFKNNGDIDYDILTQLTEIYLKGRCCRFVCQLPEQ
jgi:4-hydroxy-tetrahydrodipicolinate synthase